jgi:hypothetical protein
MEHPLELRIRERAYAIWDANGRPEGRAQEHWLMAEHELQSTDGHPTSKTTATRAAVVRKSEKRQSSRGNVKPRMGRASVTRE